MPDTLTPQQARGVLLRAIQDARLYGRERQRIEDAADGMVRAHIDAMAEAVRSVPISIHERTTDQKFIDRAAVLAILNGETP
jgi:hypothetical protein